jgi:hypothetical protein
MFKRLLFVIPFLVPFAAQAGGIARVVSSCGSAQVGGASKIGTLVDPTVDTNGYLCTSGTGGGGGGGGTSSNFGSTFPGAGTAIGVSNGTNMVALILGTQTIANSLSVTPATSSTWAATESGTWNITNITGTVSLPTGAATATGLTTINTTLGSPMQTSGGTVGISGTLPAFATTPTFNCGTGCNGTSASFGSAFPATGTASGAEYLSSPPTLTSGQLVALQTDVSGNLNVNVKAGIGGGTASSFATTFPSTGTAIGGEYLSSPPSLTNGQMGPFQLTSNGSALIDILTSSTLYTILTNPPNGAVTTSAPTYSTGTNQALSLNTSGGLRVDGSGVTQPVSSGTFATSANQPTNAAQASTTASQTGNLIQGAATTNSPAYTTAQTDPLSLDLLGRLRMIRPAILNQQTPTVTSNGTYNSGKEIGGLMTFGIAGAGTTGKLNNVIVTSKSSNMYTTLKLYIFNINPSNSTWTDDAAPAINTADIASILYNVVLPVSDYNLGTLTMWDTTNLGINFTSTTGNLYGVLVNQGQNITLTSSSTSDFTVELGVE